MGGYGGKPWKVSLLYILWGSLDELMCFGGW
jgi:hypothetical protein